MLAVTLAAGAAGWQVNGWRLGKAALALEAKRDRAFQAEVDRQVSEWKVKNDNVAAENVKLAGDLDNLRKRYNSLDQEIRHANLLPPTPVGTCAVRNPFSDEFVRLWNAAGEGSRSRE
jgi:hypothetical protein